MKYSIHVEKVWDDTVWRNLLDFIKIHKCHLFLMSPQVSYQESVLGYRGTEQELKQILNKRYGKLKELKEEYGFEVGLHTHICLNPIDLSEYEKDKIFISSYKFLDQVIGDVNGIAFGWFKYDSYLEGLCWKYDLEIFHSGISFHDYDLPIPKFKLIENWIKDKLRRLLR